MSPQAPKRAVVLLSGGLDSATVLATARANGYLCYALSVEYGQRHRAELDAAKRVAAALGAQEHRIMRVDLADIGGSALTDSRVAIPESLQPGIPVTYVPARNTLFLSLALGWAEVIGARDLFVGVNAVDYSVAGDTRVWIRSRAGSARLARIADIVALPPDNYETLAVDPESLELSWRRILGRYCHKVAGKRCFKVRLERGQQIEITEDHSLYTVENGGIVAIRGSQIKVGTPLVAPFDLSAFAGAWTSDLSYIDLGLLRLERESIHRRSSIVEVDGHLTNRLRRTRVPLRFEFTDDFLRIVGLWLAEGGKEQDGKSRTLEFSIGGLQGAAELLRRYFLMYGLSIRKNSPTNEFDFTLDSSVFYEVFRRLDLLGSAKSGRKRFPSWIWDLSQRQRRILVAALWDGDGSRVWKGEAAIHQKSHDLIYGLYDCLQLDGMFPTIKRAAHGQLRLALTRTVDLATFERLYPLWHTGKRDSLRQACARLGGDKTTSMSKSDSLWTAAAAAKLPAGSKGGKYDTSLRAPRSAFSAVPSLEPRLSSKLAFLRVVEIEPVSYEFMYDLSVEHCHNFLANGLLAHNSGYPDCRPAFIEAFERLAAVATKAGVEGAEFHIHAPLIEMSKADIIREGLRLGVDFGLTVSCYQADPNGLACGRCDSCRLRAAGFAAANTPDPTRYA